MSRQISVRSVSVRTVSVRSVGVLVCPIVSCLERPCVYADKSQKANIVLIYIDRQTDVRQTR